MASPTTDRRLGLVGNTAMKAPVTVAATSNITLSGEQTIDGVAVRAQNTAGVPDRVLVAGQTDTTTNGIYDVSTGAWTRSKDANGAYDLVAGTTVLVFSGTQYATSWWSVSTSNPITVGTSGLAWSRIAAWYSPIDASQITFTAAGSGAVQTTARSKLREVISITDFGATQGGSNAAAIALAVTAGSGRIVTVPLSNEDSALPADYSGTLLEFEGESPIRTTHTSTTSGTAKKAIKAQFPASHSGTTRSALNLEAQANGSGTNGVDSADYGLTIAIHKKGYAGGSSPPAGEIDGLSIFVRQDGPKGAPSGGASSSDASAILVNIQNVEDVGFSSAWEASTTNYNRGSASIVRGIQTQIGVLDMNAVGAPGYGYVAVSTYGANNDAFYAGVTGGATWTNVLRMPNAVTIQANGDYIAPTTDWAAGAWKIARGAGANGSTQMTHRGTGALFFYAQDAGAIQFGTNGSICWEVNTSGHFQPITDNTYNLGSSTRRAISLFSRSINLGTTSTNGATISTGTGTPEAAVTANVGSLYLRLDGGAATTLYVKESGTGNVGWVAK